MARESLQADQCRRQKLEVGLEDTEKGQKDVDRVPIVSVWMDITLDRL